VSDAVEEEMSRSGRIQELAKGGRPLSFFSPPLLLSLYPLPLLPLPFGVGLLKSARLFGERCRAKTNLVHSKAVRKPPVAIILNILSTMFYRRTIKHLAFANMTVSDGVSPSPKRGRSRLTPSKSATTVFKYGLSDNLL